ncbi:MAG: DUF2935 domain-containing protein [Herbinix sp.]|nr:DUF2935 domain-containing protein [Herbinix sp.]
MNAFSNIDAALSEHRFWLQIMGDHSRFIFFSLAPTESEYILTAQEFIILFDQLLEQSNKHLSIIELEELNRKAYEATYRLREFKIELLSMCLTSDLKSHLSPSFYNDMLNELEEYLFILNSLMNGQNPLLHPLHYHILWLTDAVGHAASIKAELDFVEKDLIKLANQFENQFQDLNIKSLMMNGYLRTGLSDFPSLERLNNEALIAINGFNEFLGTIRDKRMDGKILGSLMPLMADHMSREECYYILKLSQSTTNVRKPDCDPASPRYET